MKLIFCIDDKMGMMFFGKRQSKDRNLREWIINKVENSALWMSEYSAKQFDEHKQIIVDNHYLEKAKEEEYCFVEDGDYDFEKACGVILCHWNRQYPADKFFDRTKLDEEFSLVRTEDMIGSSHEKITIEIYLKLLNISYE